MSYSRGAVSPPNSAVSPPNSAVSPPNSAVSPPKLSELKAKYGLKFIEKYGIFEKIEEKEPSALLREILAENVPLAGAIGTEKAKSELIIAPILVELRKYFDRKISIFSGVEFNIDTENGLTGICDFIVSKSPEQLLIEAPVITLVEAKNDNLKSGLGQCLGEMIAAKLFNEQENNSLETIYGVVTTGINWQFLALNGQNVKIDLEEYSINQIRKILGILSSFFVGV